MSQQKELEKTLEKITVWVKIPDLHGIDALKYSIARTAYTVNERHTLVARVPTGEFQKCCNKANIYDVQLSNRVKRYKIYGHRGFNLKKEHLSMEQPMKKSIVSSELTPSEKEELIRLRAENVYIKTGIVAIKKDCL